MTDAASADIEVRQAKKKILGWLCHLVFDSGDAALQVSTLRAKFVYFREELQQHSTEIFSQIVRLLLNIPKQMLSNAAKTQTTCLILLQLLLECITQCPIIDQDCLNTLIDAVRVFCFWPKPYGTVAKSIFKILFLEKRNPGGGMRARLHSERMAITHDFDSHIFGSRGQKLSVPQQPTTPVLVYMDQANDSAHALQHMVCKSASPTAPLNVDQRLLMNLLEIDFQMTEPMVELLQSLSADQNSALRMQIEEVLSVCAQMLKESVSKCAALRAERVSIILKQHLPTIVLVPRKLKSGFKYVPRFPRTKYTFRELATTKLDTTKVFEEGDYLCEHVSDLLTTVTASAKRVIDLHLSRKKQRRRVLYQSRVRRATLSPRASIKLQLVDGANEPKAVLNFAILGTDQTVHRFLCGYVRLYSSIATICKHTEIRLYMIPSQDSCNDLAAYISRTDPWYRKNVFKAFTQLQSGGSAKEVKVYKQLLEDYIKSAHYTVPFRVYSCKCWKDAGEGPVAVCIPFCISADIGVRTAVERVKQQKGLTWESAFTHLRETDRGQLSTPQLRIMHSQIDGGGSAYETPRSYTVVTMRNVPHVWDTTPTDFPVAAQLELMLLDSDHFKNNTKKKKKKNSKHYKKVVGPDVLIASVKKHGEMHPAGLVEVKCTNTGDQMLVMLDGVIYGPFHHITVSQFTIGRTHRPLDFPLRTFIPRCF